MTTADPHLEFCKLIILRKVGAFVIMSVWDSRLYTPLLTNVWKNKSRSKLLFIFDKTNDKEDDVVR